MYDVVVADSRAPRDGRFIEKIGTYNPNTNPASIEINGNKAFDWVMKGAKPTDTVRAMLSYRGVMYKKHLQTGVNKGAISQEEADEKLETWLKDKEFKIQGKVDTIAKAEADKKKAALEAERIINDARVEELKKRAQEVETALVEEIKERSAEEDEDVAEDVDKAEVVQAVEETPKEAAGVPGEDPKPEAKKKTATEEPKGEEVKKENGKGG